jgi:putative peptidoglycan lipid II flippase
MLFPFLFFMGLVAFTTGVLNSRNRFTIPSFGQGVVNVSMIACIFLFYGRLKIPIYGLAFGALLGGLIQVIMQSLPLLTYLNAGA